MTAELVVLAGSPTLEEIAALVVVLGQLDAAEDHWPARPAWQCAARLEGLSEARVRSAADLRTRRRARVE